MTPRISIGFCWCFRGVTPAEGLPRLRVFGFEGIELWPDYLNAFGAERWAQTLAANKMKCFQLCPYFNFVHGPEKLEQSRRMLCDYLDAARALSCGRLRVFTGPPWGEGVVGAHTATEAQWQATITGLQEFCDRAAKEGIELCLECHEGSLMEDSASALRLLRAVNRPNLTTNLQLPLLGEDWQTSLEALANYTTHLHIHNWTEGLGRGELTYLSAGAFDWSPVLRFLTCERGRSICLSVEHADHNGRHDPWETARRDGPWLHAFRKRIQSGQ